LPLLLGLCVAAATQAQAQGLQPVPKLETRVTDLTGTLTAEQQSALEEKLAAFEARKGSQVAALIVPTTKPEEIEQYSIRVVDQWKLGRKKVDDGALLIIAKNDRAMRIEVGYGLEGVLTDATSKRIISETITPLFQQGNFFGGISAGLDQMIRVIDGEQLPPPDRSWHDRGLHGRQSPGIGGILPVLVIAVFVGSVVLRMLFGRALGSLLAGGAAGALVWVASQAVFMALLAGVIAFFFSMLSGISGGRGWSSYPRTGGWGGGWGGGLGGGGFGGGGFGGGGGGFGGGGASGRW
jgi:uncharacterized protein